MPALSVLFVAIVTLMLVVQQTAGARQTPGERRRNRWSGRSAAFGSSLVSVGNLSVSASTTGALMQDNMTSDDGARCVAIPDSLDACRSFGYRQMRLPNLLNHGSVLKASNDPWVRAMFQQFNRTMESSTTGPGAADGQCNGAGLMLFVCTMVSPVCLETPVLPCRSFCRRMKRDCDDHVEVGPKRMHGPSGRVHNRKWWRRHRFGAKSWPVDCDQLPADDQLCIDDRSLHLAPFAGNAKSTTVTTTMTSSLPPTSDEQPAEATTAAAVSPETTVLNRNITAEWTTPSEVSASQIETQSTPQTSVVGSRDRGRTDWTPSVPHVTTISRRPICVHPNCVLPEEASDVLLDNYCSTTFVAKIRPDRFVTIENDVKIVASRAVKFYKFHDAADPEASSIERIQQSNKKWSFYISRAAFTNCSCLENTPADRSPPPSPLGGNYVVMGRVEHQGRAGGHRGNRHHNHEQPKVRLEVTAIAPFESRSRDFRRALRAIKDPDACRISRPPSTNVDSDHYIINTAAGSSADATMLQSVETSSSARVGKRRGNGLASKQQQQQSPQSHFEQVNSWPVEETTAAHARARGGARRKTWKIVKLNRREKKPRRRLIQETGQDRRLTVTDNDDDDAGMRVSKRRGTQSPVSTATTAMTTIIPYTEETRRRQRVSKPASFTTATGIGYEEAVEANRRDRLQHRKGVREKSAKRSRGGQNNSRKVNGHKLQTTDV